jgi:hypothetical protein
MNRYAWNSRHVIRCDRSCFSKSSSRPWRTTASCAVIGVPDGVASYEGGAIARTLPGRQRSRTIYWLCPRAPASTTPTRRRAIWKALTTRTSPGSKTLDSFTMRPPTTAMLRISRKNRRSDWTAARIRQGKAMQRQRKAMQRQRKAMQRQRKAMQRQRKARQVPGLGRGEQQP